MEWRKHMNRLTQMASQGLGRTEKSEGFSNTLLELEKKLEDVKLVCQKSSSKLSESLLSNAGTDFEKRVRKLPMWSFANTTVEFSSKLNPIFVALAKTMNVVADGEDKLARELIQYEMEVESKVLHTLKNIADRDVPSIQKLRKQLDNYILDMNSAKSRYMKQPSDALRDEFDEAKMKVDQLQDQLAAELFSFATREEEFCRLFLTLIEAQAEFHRRSLVILERLRPSLRQEIDQHVDYPVFKTNLQDHLHHSNRSIAVVIEECIRVLSSLALTEEGLFRIAGGKSRVNRLKAAFDANMVDMDEFRNDVHCVADVLKQYLRTLPEPLMTFELFNDWMSVSQLQADRRLDAIKRILDKLPQANYENLRYLIKFLALLADQSEVNKMSPSNLAIVIGPNLLWPKEERGTNFQVASASIELLITHANWFFPGAIDFKGPDSSSADSSPHSGRRLGVHSQHAPPTVATVTSQPAVSAAATVSQPASADLISLTPSSNSYGDLMMAATLFPDSDHLEDTISLDDLSPKTTRRRRAPAPPVPVVSQQEPASPVIPSRPSLDLLTAPSTTPASLGHRRAGSASAAVSAGMVERPNIPPPAPPRPHPKPHIENGTKSAESSGADLPHDVLIDISSTVSKSVTESNALEPVSELSTEEISSNGEEKANKGIAELRAQWFQNNAVQKGDDIKSPALGGISTVVATQRNTAQAQVQVGNDLDPRPVKETPRQVATTQEAKNGVENVHETAAKRSVAAEVCPVVSHSAESVEAKLASPASKSSDGNNEHRPVPVARPRPPSSSTAVTNSNDLPADLPNNNQPKDVDASKKSHKETADTSSKPDASVVKRPPPPVVPRPANRQTSRAGGEHETSKSAVEPAVDESQEDEEEFDTRL